MGALMVLVDTQLSVTGLYLPPVFKGLPLDPPQTIISLPVHTAVCSPRASGTFVMLVEVHVSSMEPAEGPDFALGVWSAFFGCVTQTEAIATANATARRRVRMYLTGIRRPLAIYFCLHKGQFAGKHGKLASKE